MSGQSVISPGPRLKHRLAGWVLQVLTWDNSHGGLVASRAPVRILPFGGLFSMAFTKIQTVLVWASACGFANSLVGM